MLPRDDCQDIMFSDKTSGKSDSARCFESFDRYKLLSRILNSFVDFSIRPFSDSFKKRVFISHFSTLHVQQLSIYHYSIYYDNTYLSTLFYLKKSKNMMFEIYSFKLEKKWSISSGNFRKCYVAFLNWNR